MGIRVDEKALKEQLAKANCESRAELPFHKMLLEGQLPLTMGGGIGQSRICMLMLNKVHIGEVQAAVWSNRRSQRGTSAVKHWLFPVGPIGENGNKQ